MSRLKYIVSIKVNDQMIFAKEHKQKQIDEWIESFSQNKAAEEIKVYAKDNKEMSYELIYSDCKRKIGF